MCTQGRADSNASYRSFSLLVFIIIASRRFNLIDPIPLTASHLDSHGGEDGLIGSIDHHEGRKHHAEDDDSWYVEEAILSLHQQSVVPKKTQPAAWVEWQLVLTINAIDI